MSLMVMATFLELMTTDEGPADYEQVIRSLARKNRRLQIRINYLLHKVNGLYYTNYRIRQKLRDFKLE